MNAEKDWKLKLRNGKIKTAFRHYTVIAEGTVGELAEGFECRPGNAFISMKTWAASSEESSNMVVAIGTQIGFAVTGRIQIYNTEPSQPPEDVPTAYDIKFTPFDTPPAEE
jgi:hypothetical protein